MAELTFKSPGISTREIDLSKPSRLTPSGIPAGVIGTAIRGPAFVPVTFATFKDFVNLFGATDGEKLGPLAMSEWMRNARAGTYLRLLGVGDAKKRNVDGTVTNAGFVVGQDLVQGNGRLGNNLKAFADDGEVNAFATLDNALNLANQSANDEFTLTVPVAAGGDGVTRRFVIVEDVAVDAGSPANGFGILRGGDAATARLIEKAINGVADAGVSFNNGGAETTGGSFNLTAAQGSSGDTFIKLTNKSPGPHANVAVLARVTGFEGALLKTDAMAGGSSANDGSSIPGRTYFLGAFMSASNGSKIFEESGYKHEDFGTDATRHGGVPILRGVLMAPGGVILSLSSSATTNNEVSSTQGISGAFGSTPTEGDAGLHIGDVDMSTGGQNFVMLLNGHKKSQSSNNVISASFDPRSANYFANVFNTDPLKIEEQGHVLYSHYDVMPSIARVLSASSAPIGVEGFRNGTGHQAAFLLTGSAPRNSGIAGTASSVGVPNFENFEDRFSTAFSPFVISQEFGGKPMDLFRIHAKDDGAVGAGAYKVTIENVRANPNPEVDFGFFDVLIRKFDDLDGDRKVLEAYRGLSLNPAADNYIAKRIGDVHVFYDFDKNKSGQKLVQEGAYASRSSFVRVEMSQDIKNGAVPKTALPLGFRGLHHLVTSGSSTSTNSHGILAQGPLGAFSSLGVTGRQLASVRQLPVPMRQNLGVGSGDSLRLVKGLTWGVQFEVKKGPSDPNTAKVIDASLLSFVRHFPTHLVSSQKMWVGDNAGTADIGGAVLDADRYNNNKFSLEKIQVLTGSNGKPDKEQWSVAQYRRDGVATATMADKDGNLKVGRLLRVSDLEDVDTQGFANFTFPLLGGFDGVNIFDRDKSKFTDSAVRREMDDQNQGLTSGPTVASVRKAIEVMEEKADVDIQLLAVPGMRHEIVTDFALESVERRFDALYLLDVEEMDGSNTVITGSAQNVNIGNTARKFVGRNINSSFGAAYAPDVFITDPATRTRVQVPPTVVVLGAMSLNDSLGAPFTAPAGPRRGLLTSVNELKTKLLRANLDTLYSSKINPITALDGSTGIQIYGQKTLLASQSALDRINVRRLLISIRRDVKNIANRLLFEPNRESTLARFKSAVEPVLNRIQAREGLKNFRVDIDTSTTTQADVENNTIRGKIFVQPTRTVEFIALDFVVTNAGADL